VDEIVTCRSYKYFVKPMSLLHIFLKIDGTRTKMSKKDDSFKIELMHWTKCMVIPLNSIVP